MEKTIEFFRKIFSGIFIDITIAIIIILIGFIIGRVVGRLIQGLFHELELNNILKKATGIKVSFEEIAGRFVSYFIYFATIIMALDRIGITSTILYIIAGAIITIVIISLILAIKDFIPNVIAGFFIHQKRHFKEGDQIKVKDVEGKIVHINLIETRIKTKANDIIYIPNSLLTKNEVKVKGRKKRS